MDCSPVYPEAKLGCINHHDGGGWLLHPLCRALPLPPEAGALPIPPDRGQLPAGPRGIFPGHLHQQDLPQRCLICCPRSLPGELVLAAPAFSLACLLSCTFRGRLMQPFCPAQAQEGLAAAPPSSATSSSFYPREWEGGAGFLFLQKMKKKNKAVFPSLGVVW